MLLWYIKNGCAEKFRTPLSGQGVESGAVGLVLFCVSLVAGVVPWIVVFVPFVLVVLESIVAEPLTDLESLPEDPISSELVLHPATKPANANAAKNCFIISLCLCFQPVCALNLPQWARNSNGGDASDTREGNPTWTRVSCGAWDSAPYRQPS